MMPGLALFTQVAACVGLGIVILRVSGVSADFTNGERLSWAFALGYGALGWLIFFFGILGLLQPLPMALLLFGSAMGIAAFRDLAKQIEGVRIEKPLSSIDWLLFGALSIALFLDLLEGLSPPADADTLAYHFALPKEFLARGELVFIERALDGAIPLLNQMTYIPALSLGGELGLSLWTMVSGWGTTALLYSVCRRYLDRQWASAVALVFLTTPAVIYGGGSGQVEVRNALFVLVAAFSVSHAITSGNPRYAVLAGLGAGFFMAGKYTGLFFALACGLLILFQRRWFLHALVLTCTAAVAGSQWYVWNLVHTGDPFFPMLYGVLKLEGIPFWNEEHHATLQNLFLEHEQGVPTNGFWLLSYPFVAMFSGLRQFESGRTGLGPFVMLLLPFALGGVWRFRKELHRHPLFSVALIAVLFYMLWFFIGSSQRIRHLLPILPLILVVTTVSAHRWAHGRIVARPLIGATAITLCFQLFVQGLFGLNYARYLMLGEPRDTFLRRNVVNFDVVLWANKNLKTNDRAYHIFRYLNFYFNRPYYYAHVQQEAKIDIRPEADNPQKFLRQIKNLQITHLFVTGNPRIETPTTGVNQWRPLLQDNCMKMVDEIKTQLMGPRTFGVRAKSKVYVLRVSDGFCNKL